MQEEKENRGIFGKEKQPGVKHYQIRKIRWDKTSVTRITSTKLTINHNASQWVTSRDTTKYRENPITEVRAQIHAITYKHKQVQLLKYT